MDVTKIKAIVTDIEGTTSSISFVKEVLFPYAYEKLPDFVKSNIMEQKIITLLQDVRDLQKTPQATTDECIHVLLKWIEGDKKITPLKTLQGMIWKRGFEEGSFKGHLYADAYETLKKWHQLQIPLYIYSSGSIAAQKLYFGYSDFGDLTPWFVDYFDTTIGSKVESESYLKIASKLKLLAPNILFLSDNLHELDAARKTGMKTIWLNRDGSKELSTHVEAKDFYAKECYGFDQL